MKTKQTICKVCNQKSHYIFQSKILKKYKIEYFHCEHCGFLQTENPYWLEEAYSRPINKSDTGYIRRNQDLSMKLTILLVLFFDHKKQFIDYAGGYGVFVRMMRDIGFDYYWLDKYSDNIFASGFEFNDADDGPIEAVTAFECFEHFSEPIDEIQTILKLSKNIIFTTEILPADVPLPEKWWYYGLDHGQHISFYREKTLIYIATKFELVYLRAGSIHIITQKVHLKSWKLMLLKLSRFGLHYFLKQFLNSKTWNDHLYLKEV